MAGRKRWFDINPALAGPGIDDEEAEIDALRRQAALAEGMAALRAAPPPRAARPRRRAG